MRDYSDEVRSIYDSDPEREWQRMDRHRTEFAVTLRALQEHLPAPPARILDCGSGPGRYALELARMGYEVTLFDLSSNNLETARRKAEEAGLQMAGYELGDARSMERFADSSYDAVLLLGPLYHLFDEADRIRALFEASRVLKPGGSIFAAFIMRYAVYRFMAAFDPMMLLERGEEAEKIIEDGRALPYTGEPGEFIAYMARPDEVEPLLWSTGLEVEKVLGVEGLVARLEEGVNALEGEAWQKWANLNYRVAHDPLAHACSDHMLAIAVKPRWRGALKEIAARLNESGEMYTVVGGTCAALHGIPIPIKDIDIELSSQGAYRFQQIFKKYVVKAVEWSESDQYRSHFGRFRMDEVNIEVMGDLERRVGNAWKPSRAATREAVDLEGVPVSTSWLEEESLAYLRRGRLLRASQCIPHCDPERLRSLLVRETHTDVI